MNESQLMGLDSDDVEIYDIHGYFHRLTVGQRTPGFWDVTNVVLNESPTTSQGYILILHFLPRKNGRSMAT